MAAIEFGVLAVVAVALAAVYLSMKLVKPLVYNAIVGLVVLVVVDLLGLVAVEISALVVAIVALGGVPGAVLVSLLALLDVAFVPALLV